MSIRKRILVVFLVYVPAFFIFSGFLETTSGLNQKGNKEFQSKHYDSALEAYRKAQVKSPGNPEVRYNLGTTLYQLDQFQEAERELHEALLNSKTKELKATAWYNYGNTRYRLGQFEEAEKAYHNVLDLNPADKDAKYNLELLQKKKKMFDLKQNKRDQEKKQNPPPSSSQQQQQGGGGGKGQDKQDKQSQDNQKGENQNQGQESKPDQNQDQNQSQKQDQTEQDQGQKESQQNQNQQEKDQENSQGTQKPEQAQEKPQEMAPAKPEPGEGQESDNQQKQEQEGRELRPLYQGQMSKENALRILDALKDSEKELQLLRRPKPQSDREPLKDW